MTHDRKRYLAAACIAYIRKWDECTIFYDGATCDGVCLIDDLRAEFGIDDGEEINILDGE